MSSTSRLGTAAVIPNSAALDKAVSHTASQKRKDLYYIKVSLKLLIFIYLFIYFKYLFSCCFGHANRISIVIKHLDASF